jgi:hypothetical protein
MEAYCNAVQHLEDRFDDLELSHIVHKYNEATDELTKIALDQTMVPLDIFTSDLHKPSIDYGKPGQEGNQPPDPTLGSDPLEGSNPPQPPNPRS